MDNELASAEREDNRWNRTVETPKQCVIVITDKESSDNVEKPVEKVGFTDCLRVNEA